MPDTLTPELEERCKQFARRVAVFPKEIQDAVNAMLDALQEHQEQGRDQADALAVAQTAFDTHPAIVAAGLESHNPNRDANLTALWLQIGDRIRQEQQHLPD